MAKKKKGRQATAGADALPPEIWSQIRTNLPAKSVLQCRRVCKTWYSLIPCPIFVSDHHTTTNRVLLNRFDTTTTRQTLSFHDDSFLESPDSPLPLPGGMGIVGSCNGLVCFHKRDHASDYRPDGTYDMLDTFLIWNPTIGKSVRPPLRFSSTDEVYYIVGFGFDPVTNDYKLLRIGYPVFYESDSEDDLRVEFDDLVANVAPLVSEIFDLRKGVWRSLSPPVQQFYTEEPCLCVYLHGHLHWIRNERFLNCTILSFNLSSELFREMWVPGAGEQPDEDDDDPEDYFQDGDLVGYTKIFAISGLLSVAVAMARKELRGDLCTVWSMKEYGVTESWTKMFRVEVPLGEPYQDRWLNLLQFWEDGRVLMVKHTKGCDVVVLYNPKSNEPKVLLSTNERILDVCFYSETLVLL